MEGVPLGDFFERANNDIENEVLSSVVWLFLTPLANTDPICRKSSTQRKAQTQHHAHQPLPKWYSRVKTRRATVTRTTSGKTNITRNDLKGNYHWRPGAASLLPSTTTFASPTSRALPGSWSITSVDGMHSLAIAINYKMIICANSISSVSWEWFYPYFYAPLFSDLVNLSSYKISFSLGSPFTPYQQLLGYFACVRVFSIVFILFFSILQVYYLRQVPASSLLPTGC